MGPAPRNRDQRLVRRGQPSTEGGARTGEGLGFLAQAADYTAAYHIQVSLQRPPRTCEMAQRPGSIPPPM
eukprot:2073515-Pyramimonas_sp.AAC.1